MSTPFDMPAEAVVRYRATAQHFTDINPILATNTIGYETDAGKSKWGDSVTAWASLGYSNEEGSEIAANKDASGGYVGKTLQKINFKNTAATFISFLVNAATAARTYTFQDRDGTIADNTDLALKAPLASPVFTTAVTLPAAVNSALPTADPHVVGRLWANSGVVTVSAG